MVTPTAPAALPMRFDAYTRLSRSPADISVSPTAVAPRAKGTVSRAQYPTHQASCPATSPGRKRPVTGRSCPAWSMRGMETAVSRARIGRAVRRCRRSQPRQSDRMAPLMPKPRRAMVMTRKAKWYQLAYCSTRIRPISKAMTPQDTRPAVRARQCVVLSPDEPPEATVFPPRDVTARPGRSWARNARAGRSGRSALRPRSWSRRRAAARP